MKSNLTIEDINKLPETVPTEQLKEYFRKCCDQIDHTSLQSKEYAFEILNELANKQWHNYEKADAHLLGLLNEVVIKALQGEISFQLIKNIPGIVSGLGLQKSYISFQALLDISDLPVEIRKEISETIEEFGEDVSDPYQSFK